MEVRQPRGLVKINGARVDGWTAIETEENDYVQPDNFTVDFAMSALAKETDAAWFASQATLDFEIFIGFPADGENFNEAELDSMFFGRADDIDFDWLTGKIRVTGRDLTARLMDHKSSEKHVNLTASQIARKVAAKYGLTPVVTETSTKAGKLYQLDKVDLQVQRTEWDLLTWLAQEEGFVCYTQGRELHFEPRPPEGQASPYVVKRVAETEALTQSGNYVSLSTGRSLTVARDIKVTVRSWNSKRKRAFERVARRSGGGGDVQEYNYTIAGLDPDQAQKRAQQILEDLSKHQMRLAFEGPADNELRLQKTIRLEGTETAFDQVYYPESIIRALSKDEGYTMDVRAKNQVPGQETT
jgi:phage protein D